MLELLKLLAAAFAGVYIVSLHGRKRLTLAVAPASSVRRATLPRQTPRPATRKTGLYTASRAEASLA